MKGITLGTDPEVCVVDTNGEIVPAGWCFDAWQTSLAVTQPLPPTEGMPPKGRKLQLANLGPGYTLYEDGASLEFNLPVAHSTTEMVNFLRQILREADRLVTQVGYQIVIKASLPITDEVIKRGGVALSRFGCDPDSTLWDDPYDPSMVDASACYRRYYGGHIHMGTPEYCDEEFYYDNRWEISVACDVLLGLSDVIIDPSEEARLRRQVYGRVGRHRVQSYAPHVFGFEYRVPSNGWLLHPEYTEYMFNMAQIAAYTTTQPLLFDTLVNGVRLDWIKNAINQTDPVEATKLFYRQVSPYINDLKTSDQDIVDLDLKLGAVFSTFDTDWRTAWSL
jgi:hypothetical protein